MSSKISPEASMPDHMSVQMPKDFEDHDTPSLEDSSVGIRESNTSLKRLSSKKRKFLRSKSLRITVKQLARCNTYQLEHDSEPESTKVIGKLGAVFALVQSALGSGILALPYGLAQTGLPIGYVLMFCALMLNAYSSTLLIKIGETLKRRNFERMAIVTCGPCYAKFLNIVLVIDALLKVIGLHVICKNLLPHALRSIAGTDSLAPILTSTYFLGPVLTLCFFYPLALIRNLKILQYMGLVGFTATLYFVFLVVLEFFRLVEPSQR